MSTIMELFVTIYLFLLTAVYSSRGKKYVVLRLENRMEY